MPNPQETGWRLRRSLVAIVSFLIGFAGLITVVVYYYLLPAMDAARDADSAGRRQLSAYSTLLLAILLFVIIVGLLMTFRIHRFFFPRPSAPRAKTEHIDAWVESGRRLNVPPPDEDDA